MHLSQIAEFLTEIDKHLDKLQHMLNVDVRSMTAEKQIKHYRIALKLSLQITSRLQQISDILSENAATSSSSSSSASTSNPTAIQPSEPHDQTLLATLQSQLKTQQTNSEKFFDENVRHLVNSLITRKNEIDNENQLVATTPSTTLSTFGLYSQESHFTPSLFAGDATATSAAALAQDHHQTFFQRTFPGDYTVAHLAVLADHADLLRMAVAHGVSLYHKDEAGNQAIVYTLAKPHLLLLLLGKPIDLSNFNYGNTNLKTWVEHPRDKVDPRKQQSYDLLRHFQHACYYQDKDFFVTMLRQYHQHLTLQEKVDEELKQLSSKAALTAQEMLRFHWLRQTDSMIKMTLPYQNLVHQLFYNSKVSLSDFTLPENPQLAADAGDANDTNQDKKAIIRMRDEWRQINPGHLALPSTEHPLFLTAADSCLHLISFVQQFRAMHLAIQHHFPQWKTNLHENLCTISQDAMEDYCVNSLTAIFTLFTQQYQGLQSTLARAYYQMSINKIFSTGNTGQGMALYSEFVSNFQADREGNDTDSENLEDSHDECDSDNDTESSSDNDDDNAEKKHDDPQSQGQVSSKQQLFTLPQKDLLALRQNYLPIMTILRFLSLDRRLRAVKNWQQTLTPSPNESSANPAHRLPHIQRLPQFAAVTALNHSAPAALRKSSELATARFAANSTSAVVLSSHSPRANSPQSSPRDPSSLRSETQAVPNSPRTVARSNFPRGNSSPLLSARHSQRAAALDQASIADSPTTTATPPVNSPLSAPPALGSPSPHQ